MEVGIEGTPKSHGLLEELWTKPMASRHNSVVNGPEWEDSIGNESDVSRESSCSERLSPKRENSSTAAGAGKKGKGGDK